MIFSCNIILILTQLGRELACSARSKHGRAMLSIMQASAHEAALPPPLGILYYIILYYIILYYIYVRLNASTPPPPRATGAGSGAAQTVAAPPGRARVRVCPDACACARLGERLRAHRLCLRGFAHADLLTRICLRGFACADLLTRTCLRGLFPT